ncbi:MAG: GH3 auxin-responsive promoter family protein [Saprospiraceae bacterium]|nr:GH3 auxin-responsive promoter family protein [Saprospiraceae bacterium]
MPIVGEIVKRAFSLAHKAQGGGLSPFELQSKTLHKLLKKAEYTAFGKKYNFHDILRDYDLIQAFQDQVPFFDYDKIYDEWWHRALNYSESNVTWAGQIPYFALSSGTTGAPSKYIPITADMIRAIRTSSLRTFFAATRFGLGSDFFGKQGLFVSGSATLKQHDNAWVGDMSGISMKSRPMWAKGLSKPEHRIQSMPDWSSRLDAIARSAPKWDIVFLSGLPSWVQVMIERVMAHNKLGSIHEIWPNLRVFAHGGIAFEPHRAAFDRLMTKPMIYIDTYLASEGFIASQNRLETRSMALILDNGVFHEFIPFNDANFDSDGQIKGKPRAYSVDEVEEGIEYALAISTCAGAWRYVIGDTVRFTDVCRKELVITGRTKHFLSVTGEHLSVDNMNQGVQYAAETLKIDVKEFTVSPVLSDGKYAHKWYIGCEPLPDTLAFKKLLDEKICNINDDYATERTAVLRAPQIVAVPPRLFHEYLNLQGKGGGQAKFPRVLKPEAFADWEKFVAAKNLSSYTPSV